MDFGLPDLFSLVSRQKHQTIPISIRGRICVRFESEPVPHTDKGQTFTAFPPFEEFLQQKKEFPNYFCKSGNPLFLSIFSCFHLFSCSATASSRYVSATCEGHIYHYGVGYGKDMSTGCVFQQVYRKFKTTSLVVGNISQHFVL